MRIINYILILLLIASCKKNEIGPQLTNIDSNLEFNSSRILILNEGNFNFNNASLSILDIEKETISNNAYYNINNQSLGDIAQSAIYYNSKCYIVVNNAQKILILDSITLEYEAEITNLSSPRYILPIGNKAYVTNLYVNNSFTNQMYVVDLNTYQVIKTIQTEGYTENLLLHNNKVYVTKRNSNEVLKINPTNDSIEKSISVPYDPIDIVIDKNNNIWILCTGGYTNQETPKLIQLSTSNDSIIKEIAFPSITMNPSQLRIDEENENLYFISGDIYKLNINSNQFPSSAIITATNEQFYGLEILNNNDIIATDASDFQQTGFVKHYNSNYQLQHSYNAGIIPQFILKN